MTKYEVVLNFMSPGGVMLNVLHYDINGDEPFNFQAMADEFRTSFVAGMASVIAPAITFESITVRLDSPGEVGQTFPFTSGDAPGTSTDDQYAGQLSVLVRKLAGNLVRPNKGRAYQGGVTSEGLTAGGLWTQTVLDAVQVFWADVIQVDFTGPSQADMQIKASNPTAPNTVPYNPVNTMSSRSNPTTQRRRRRGEGV